LTAHGTLVDLGVIILLESYSLLRTEIMIVFLTVFSHTRQPLRKRACHAPEARAVVLPVLPARTAVIKATATLPPRIGGRKVHSPAPATTTAATRLQPTAQLLKRHF